MKKLILLAVFALAVAAPVQAHLLKPTPPTHPAHPAHPAKPTPPNKCQPHAVSYRVSGTVVSGSLVLNGDGSYMGTVTVQVTKANHEAKADKGTVKPYTLTSARVNLHHENAAALTAGSRIELKGTITTLAKKCDHTGFVATITIAKADVHPPKSSH